MKQKFGLKVASKGGSVALHNPRSPRRECRESATGTRLLFLLPPGWHLCTCISSKGFRTKQSYDNRRTVRLTFRLAYIISCLLGKGARWHHLCHPKLYSILNPCVNGVDIFYMLYLYFLFGSFFSF